MYIHRIQWFFCLTGAHSSMKWITGLISKTDADGFVDYAHNWRNFEKNTLKMKGV